MARQKLGQHFLIDNQISKKIVESGLFNGCESVIEVGPGTGALSDHLIQNHNQFGQHSIFLIEYDPNLSKLLSKKFSKQENVKVLNVDARFFDLKFLPRSFLTPYSVIGNLPYYAATPIVRNFLELKKPPAQMVFMVQKEVANEMIAKQGKFSLLSLSVQIYAKAEILFNVDRTSFRPPPKVDSSVIKLIPHIHPDIDIDNIDNFFYLAKAAFKLPRKQLHNSISRALNIPIDEVKHVLYKSDIDHTRRASTLSIKELNNLTYIWSKHFDS